MNIVDKRFGAEVVTSTSKVYKFDSIECMSAYESQLAQSGEQSQSMWVVDYYVPESFLALPSSTIIRTKGIRSPMGLGFVAVASAADAAKFTTEYGGDILDWAQVSQVVRDAWSDGH
jgi:copper chaperone NosL